MSQLSRLIPTSGPGSGTVTSISEGTGITLTPNPITTVGTVSLTVPVIIANGGTNTTSFSTIDGTVYYDGTSLVTTATGTSGQVLTSNGAGVPPTYQSIPGTFANSFPTDAGTATPAAGILNVLGGTAGRDINTTGAGNTIHVELNNAITLGDLVALGAGVNAMSATTGDVNIAAGSLKLPNTNTAGDQGEIKVGGARWLSNWGGVTFGGFDNAFVGRNSGNTTNTGNGNAAFGELALNAITTGNFNNAFGYKSLLLCTTGTTNCAFGNLTLDEVTTGSGNCAFGAGAGTKITTASFNVCLGGASGTNITTGTTNLCVGTSAGVNFSSGNYNTLIGANATGTNYTIAETSNLIISNPGVAGENNTIRLGATGVGNSQQDRCFIAGTDGVNVGSTAKVVTMGTAATAEQLGTAVITAGANVTVTPGANLITIAATTPAAVATSYSTDSGSAVPAANVLTVAGGLNIDTSGAGSTVTIAASPDQYLTSYRVANATPFLVNATDFYITVDTSTTAITIQLPDAPTIYRRFVVKDSAGNAAAQNITVTTVSGIKSIDAATTFVMNTNYQAAEFVYDNFGYQIF